jgi:hypothetical protein
LQEPHGVALAGPCEQEPFRAFVNQIAQRRPESVELNLALNNRFREALAQTGDAVVWTAAEVRRNRLWPASARLCRRVSFVLRSKVQFPQQVLKGHAVVRGNALENGAQRPDLHGIVVGNDFMVFAALVRREPDVRSLLASDTITEARQSLH